MTTRYDLERPEVPRHQRVGDGGQLLGRDHGDDAGGEQNEDELAAEGGKIARSAGSHTTWRKSCHVERPERGPGLQLTRTAPP